MTLCIGYFPVADQYRGPKQEPQATDKQKTIITETTLNRSSTTCATSQLAHPQMANHFSQTADTSSAGPGYSAYRPSLYPANDLDPITISQMKMETHHHGKQTVIHVLVPPKRAVALVALVEDEQGSVTWLQLYNQPSETVVPAEEILRRGSCYLLKEPFLTSDPTASLRVDHPGDIMLLPREHKLVPARWRVTELVFGLSYDPTMLGNDAAGKKRWAEAERL